jgi:hypothetical protein
MDNDQEVISRLKFIGTFKKGEKINTRHLFVQPNGINTALSRTFMHPDNRGNALTFCKDVITSTFELMESYQKSEHTPEKTLYKTLRKDFDQAIIGMNNLKSTYILDNKFCCDMDTLLDNTIARLEQF